MLTSFKSREQVTNALLDSIVHPKFTFPQCMTYSAGAANNEACRYFVMP